MNDQPCSCHDQAASAVRKQQLKAIIAIVFMLLVFICLLKYLFS